jgi:hypothetical protein
MIVVTWKVSSHFEYFLLSEQKPDLVGGFMPEKLEAAQAALLPLLITESVEFGLGLENAVLVLLTSEGDHDREDDGLTL